MRVNLDQMYSGIPYSPYTRLTNNISATATEIEVDEPNKLPAAPNLASIGTDENGETIRYTSKVGKLLKNVQRGFEGTAKAWPKETEIMRTFTHSDYRAITNNIEKLAENANNSYLYVDDNGVLTFVY